jgi:hypothetical protein
MHTLKYLAAMAACVVFSPRVTSQSLMKGDVKRQGSPAKRMSLDIQPHLPHLRFCLDCSSFLPSVFHRDRCANAIYFRS